MRGLSGMVDTLWPLPDGWEWVALGNPNLVEIVMGQSPPSKTYNTMDQGLPFFQEKAEFGDLYPSPVKWCSSPTKIGLIGDVLISVRAPVGPTNLVKEKCSIGRGLAGLRPKGNLETFYLLYCLRCLETQISGKGRGSAFNSISKTDIAQFKIPIPYPNNPKLSLDIQQRIVARIESLLGEIKWNRLLLEQMRLDNNELMDSALNEVFSHIRQGFEVTGISQDQIKSIDEITKIERGKFSHRPRNDSSFFGGDMPWIQIQNIPKDGNKFIKDYMSTLNKKGIAISKIFPKGTLVLSVAATIGAVGILSFDSCFPDSLVGITPNNDIVDAGFLYWQLLYIRNHLETIAPAAAQKNINLQILRKINLWIPEKNQQKIIDNHLDFIQEKKQEMETFIQEDIQNFNYLEQAILEKAFRGEL